MLATMVEQARQIDHAIFILYGQPQAPEYLNTIYRRKKQDSGLGIQVVSGLQLVENISETLRYY